MYKINPLLESDFYKQVHWNQYPKGVTKVVSYFVPRMTRIKGENHLIMFGLQSFIKEFLIESFNEYFFGRPKKEIIAEYKHLLDNTLGEGLYGLERIGELHDLGYLPIEIKALPEGTRVPIGVPMFEISNTHPRFAWLTNALESVISCEMWHAMISANVGYMYRKIVDAYYDKTCDDNIPHRRALGDFSMRGQESKRSAYKSSAGWLLSFVNTATVPAVAYLEKYYNCDCSKEEVGFGAVSTEHSVMCSNFAVDGDEITFVKRLLTELYPNTSFSMVSDSYDYWNLVDNILPQCREEIMKHNGCLLVRGDSGDPVEVVTQTVFHLWEQFGGTTNSKGYKVLDPHVKALYGDSITPTRAQKIYSILEENGFAASNVSLGVGSFSMQCLEEEVLVRTDDGQDEKVLNYETVLKLNPYTRDTFGIAIKASYCEDVDGNPIQIFKCPKEASFKKSHKGCIIVAQNKDSGELTAQDEHTFEETYCASNALISVFKDGVMIKEYSLKDIRARLYGDKF